MRAATVIPDNERWLHVLQAAADLQNALAWAKTNPPTDTSTDAVLEKLNDQS